MDMQFTGKAYVLGEAIDTDQIIPAQYLVYNPADANERKYFGRYALAGVPDAQAGLPDGHVAFVPDGGFTSDDLLREQPSRSHEVAPKPERGFTTEYRIVVAGSNFGCGSSREHAPLALAEAGVKLVIAESYARIFFRNTVNGGYVLPAECRTKINDRVHTGDELAVDLETHTVRNLTRGEAYELKPLGDILPILEAGDIFKYARAAGMLG